MASTRSSISGDALDVNKLMYQFDFHNPWGFSGGAPTASSVERGRRKKNPKLKKIYVRKQRAITARRNRPHKDIEKMSLVCSCDQGCLIKHESRALRLFIHELRQSFYRKNYNEQNYILARLLEIKVCPSGLRRITYKIPTLGTVCRGAFVKCYGISKAKIEVLLKKIAADGVSIQQDMRGKHEHETTKLLPEARQTVIDFICSYDASESHYRRAVTNKKYFDCNVTMKGMWREFSARHPNFKTNRSKRRNTGPVISFSAFRSIYCQDLRDTLSFRKARMDTCQFCDQTQNTIKQISSEVKSGNSRRAREMKQKKQELETHLKESEVRFASLKYDMLVLAKKL